MLTMGSGVEVRIGACIVLAEVAFNAALHFRPRILDEERDVF